MTAEVCILNKTAVAMAADSAVTISYGDTAQKIYESADKLFELSTSQPIGIMIYNGMSFMEMPLPTIIKSFRRKQTKKFKSVSDAGQAFLEHLHSEAKNSPDSVNARAIQISVQEVISQIKNIMNSGETVFSIANRANAEKRDYNEIFDEVLREKIDNRIQQYDGVPEAKFIGGNTPRITQKIKNVFTDLIKASFSVREISDEAMTKFIELSSKVMKGKPLSPSFTGIVVTGFGEEDRFPTLIAYRIDGIVGGKLKYIDDEKVDIDRLGPVARIVPFAQKEMVDRFVYGIDDDVIGAITGHCETGVTELTTQLESVVPDADLPVFKDASKAGSEAFISKIKGQVIHQIRENSRREIEDMVSMMPKPELANMAEALVELTSLKRRVSVGFETVGGPVDVAIISREDGFVWVKRKHYFPAEKNYRFRMRTVENSHHGDK